MQKEQRLSYYINKAKSLHIEKYEKRIKIGLLGSFTLNGFSETLQVKCAEQNIGCITYVSGYNQYNQDILDTKSGLYKFDPDVVFLILDTRSVLGDLFYFPYSISETDRKNTIRNKIQSITTLIQSFTTKSNSKLIITNLPLITYSPYGIFETKTDYGIKQMINDFNSQLVAAVKDNDAIYTYDFNGFVTQYGELNVFNYKQYFLGDFKISLDCIPYLIRDLFGFIKPILGLSKKCIVLDLDNTLWGGIVGEDGFNGIKIGNDPSGKAFLELQKRLLALHKRGIILAINSKNNQEDAIEVLKNHPNMILKEEHFASVRINWEDKVENMKEIASELNIGLDSMVFFDDDPINREYVRSSLPQVLTVELSQDPSEYAQILISMNDFDVWKITTEDVSRGQMYMQDKQRKDLQKSVTNIEEFLKNLDIKLKIKKANNFTIPRISQLTLKTNQFNLTTKRYQEEDIKKLSNENYLIECVQVEDKFGDNGITGIFIVKKQQKEWFIDTFLLSCRIMGRGIEDGMLGHILKKAKNEGVDVVKGEFIATKKNAPAENFLLNYGFKKDGNYWIYNVKDNPIKIPSHLNMSIEDD